jgi:hypothetical protein
VDHVVHSGASGAQNIAALLFMLGWDQYGLHKKRAGTGYTELVFLHLVGVCVSRSAFVHPGCETSTHFFSFSGGPSVVSIKSTAGHVTTNLCYRIQWDLSVT